MVENSSPELSPLAARRAAIVRKLGDSVARERSRIHILHRVDVEALFQSSKTKGIIPDKKKADEEDTETAATEDERKLGQLFTTGLPRTRNDDNRALANENSEYVSSGFDEQEFEQEFDRAGLLTGGVGTDDKEGKKTFSKKGFQVIVLIEPAQLAQHGVGGLCSKLKEERSSSETIQYLKKNDEEASSKCSEISGTAAARRPVEEADDDGAGSQVPEDGNSHWQTLQRTWRRYGCSEIHHYPIPDFEVPKDIGKFQSQIQKWAEDIRNGVNFVVHCFAGRGRSGLVVGSLVRELHHSWGGDAFFEGWLDFILEVNPQYLDTDAQFRFVQTYFPTTTTMDSNCISSSSSDGGANAENRTCWKVYKENDGIDEEENKGADAAGGAGDAICY